MIKKLSILFIISILSGCAAFKQQPDVAIETKNILIVPPDELMVKCAVEPPPMTTVYVSSEWPQKEDLLIKHSSQQMKNLFKCNEMIKSLNDWKKRQIELYPAKPIK